MLPPPWTDPITWNEYAATEPAVRLGHYLFHPETFLWQLRTADLGININVASLDEFILTASHDCVDNTQASSPCRFRNSLTNLPFSFAELTQIYTQVNAYLDTHPAALDILYS